MPKMKTHRGAAKRFSKTGSGKTTILDAICLALYNKVPRIANAIGDRTGVNNDDTLLYGVEVKFYNMEVEVNDKLESRHPGLYVIGDGSGITHSLSHSSASGVYVARKIAEER